MNTIHPHIARPSRVRVMLADIARNLRKVERVLDNNPGQVLLAVGAFAVVVMSLGLAFGNFGDFATLERVIVATIGVGSASFITALGAFVLGCEMTEADATRRAVKNGARLNRELVEVKRERDTLTRVHEKYGEVFGLLATIERANADAYHASLMTGAVEREHVASLEREADDHRAVAQVASDALVATLARHGVRLRK